MLVQVSPPVSPVAPGRGLCLLRCSGSEILRRRLQEPSKLGEEGDWLAPEGQTPRQSWGVKAGPSPKSLRQGSGPAWWRPPVASLGSPLFRQGRLTCGPRPVPCFRGTSLKTRQASGTGWTSRDLLKGREGLHPHSSSCAWCRGSTWRACRVLRDANSMTARSTRSCLKAPALDVEG